MKQSHPVVHYTWNDSDQSSGLLLYEVPELLLDLRKENDLAIKSILQQYNSFDHNIENKTEEMEVECSGGSVSDMQATIAELQSMRGPISIFINVLVVFGNLADEINKIDMERSDSAPGDTSVSSCRPKIAPLSAMLDLKADLEKHLMRIVGSLQQSQRPLAS